MRDEISTGRRLAEIGVIPVVELESVQVAEPLLEALIRGGLPAAEITLRSEAGLASIARLRERFPQALIGAGTVRSSVAARRVIDEGAQFVVAPGVNPEIVQICSDRGILAVPGVCTPTEVDRASLLGLSLAKFFPAEAMGGIGFLKALAGPFREMLFLPTGGINAANLSSYLALPSVVACGGSWMASPELLRDGRFDEVETRARDAVRVVHESRAGA
jgi:2-dehydro-3-deoxyphosphogluconate aldolase/(4S)-4-hydroxy-2-oxoglutarate aldolase